MTYAEDLFLATRNRTVLGEYFERLVEEPVWSSEDPRGRRILFSHALASNKAYSPEFDQPGCYIFGVNQRVLYVGRTTKKLWTRLRGRYFIGERTQHQLPKTYERGLIETGLSAFPPEIIADYKRQYSGSTVRLDGAVMFARCGVEHVWFHLFPVRDGNCTPELERILMSFCASWNEEHGFGPMLNLRYER
ncbi:MAG: hypothetical protein AB7I48_09375 [Planctomycetaceae bacterium]